MKKQRHRESESIITIRLWSYAQAVSALPFLRGIVRSLREHWLDMRQAQMQVRRIDARSGRPDRRALISREEAVREATRAAGEFEETFRELTALDVYCLDPSQGLALIPFRQGDEVAWFVFDLFAPQGLEAWRYQADPLETRRPLVAQSDPALWPRLSANEIDLLMSRGAPDADATPRRGRPG